MNRIELNKYLVSCGLENEEYDLIRPLLWDRNRRILKVTSILSGAMGLLFLGVQQLLQSGVWLPYLFLFCGSAAIYLLTRFVNDRHPYQVLTMLLCYAQMVLDCAYAGFLSTQPSNYAIPATSVVVFIAVLPLSIDDRPVRMYLFMLAESAAYLAVSFFMKSEKAFSLDMLNVATFCLVGMILYVVICARNVREIYQSIHVARIQQNVITSLATVVEERDENTGGHILRTEDYVRGLTGQMKGKEAYAALSSDFNNNVILAAPMHDIGKIKIPDRILNKPGRLTEEEYEIIKTHSVCGADIIRKTMANVEEGSYLEIACNIARHHHERYDGTGYPDGLSGEAIPLEARIMALADVYDALISERVYKPAFSKEEAARILREGSGTQFDPALTALFLAFLETR